MPEAVGCELVVSEVINKREEVWLQQVWVEGVPGVEGGAFVHDSRWTFIRCIKILHFEEFDAIRSCPKIE